jgi:hypothetical protein
VIICNGGRNASEFDTQGTGTGLWIQNGPNPVAHTITIPQTVADADASKWTKGACFFTMGTSKISKLSKVIVFLCILELELDSIKKHKSIKFETLCFLL